ncbi:uncharacterized protein SOCE26_067190 [Sorangium cellulosum]|uniref:Uncharacterized protein n=1 Tax=Sorangium cellulosum TaxID=56 RepID=A0A2L0F0Y6_SORCE|nr:uncharacterized protein SOCE26_067190 [Sorangium cellulosum]
MSFYYCQAS